MQRLGGQRLSHVLPFRTPSSTKIQIRSSHQNPYWIDVPKWPVNPKRKKWKTFEASSLILDLDAEDNRYVRPYDKDVDSIIAQKVFEEELVKRRVAEFEQISQDNEDRFNATATNQFGAWRISDLDVLSTALDGPPVSETERPNNAHSFGEIKGDVFKMNGIPTQVWNSNSRSLAYMVRRQEMAQRRQPSIGEEALLEDTLQKCHSFLEVERLVSNVIQTPEGLQILSKCTESLGQICEVVAPTTTPPQMLPFLNDLVLNLDSQGLHISSSLLWRAFWACLECGIFSMAQRYTKMIHSRKYTLDKKQAFASLKLLSNSIPTLWREDIDIRFGSDTTHKLLAIYGLLTGRILGEEQPQPSLLDIVVGNQNIFNSKNSRIFDLYVATLARLGAVRTLWYLWHRGESSTKGAMADYAKGDIYGRAIQDLINDNSRFGDLARGPQFARTTGKLDEDCRFDMEAIINMATFTPTHDTGATYTVDNTTIRGIFRKESIMEAMSTLRAYLKLIMPPTTVKNE
ncbi:uncharacterized protein F4822DRAFT_14856 [Hypoxylon trugodes]|uniref:uncharacterized protein n=1 Tax=Hypoxylon trugodes TaxID=326681 RepID=UPI00218EB40C|nr:uncharacterized protein F4822DRAFT_14856 [Hypoxylon trugodes]KAI1393487.1 hypothetical protein F4822DRAFT_14856 [Hypoxylon trugodes]